MTIDGLVITAAAITVVWSVFSCAFGVLVAKSIRLADDREPSARDAVPRSGAQRSDQPPP
ncbi:hypothetical protein OG579_02840 [Williamsia herbipolensis]|uniref:Uncharacterized protein n=1 Tax=Williamsia herbipolensis TaxID=1603258 RepID=A0AAU4K402_9NOCA|nr:hypothetical protein [Williamsia herbipolensis]